VGFTGRLPVQVPLHLPLRLGLDDDVRTATK
jgi:hypothetical protein